MEKKIIHKAIYHEHQLITIKYSAVLRKDVIYLCNQAVKANRDKCRFQWKYVTCINCLKQKPTSLNKDLEVSASPTPKELLLAIPSLNPDIKCNKIKVL